MAEPPVERLARVRRLVPWALGLGAFGVYALAAAPGPYWLDSQELGAAGVRLGVPHPTGFPLYCLLARLASLAPLGELAFRVHLLSAACAGVTVGLVARLAAEAAGDDAAAVAGGAGAGLLLAGSTTFFRSATVAEVYAPTGALVALGLLLALRVARGAGRGRAGLALALIVGLAAGAHAQALLLLGAPLFVLWFWRLRRGARWTLAAPALAALGAAGTLVYLPLRAASGRIAAVDWGHPATWAALRAHASGERIRRAFEGEMASGAGDVVSGNAGAFAAQVDASLGTLALVAAAAGLVALAATRRGRAAAALLGAVAAADFVYSAWVNPMGIEDRQNGVPLAIALAALAGAGIVAAARRFGRAAPFAGGALAVIVAVPAALDAAPAKLGRSDAPRAWAEAALEQAPPGAVALVQSDSTAAGLLWLTAVEGARPDVAVLVAQHLWDERRDRAVLGAAGLALAEGAGVLAAVRSAGLPLLWEPGTLPPPRDATPRPGVPLWPLDAMTPGVPVATARTRLHALFGPPALDDPNARRQLVAALVNLGAAAARAGDPARAALLAEEALSLRPDHPPALVAAARWRLVAGDDATARLHAERAVRVAPFRADAWALLGTLDARAGQWDAARRHLTRALALDPTNPEALTNLSKLPQN